MCDLFLATLGWFPGLREQDYILLNLDILLNWDISQAILHHEVLNLKKVTSNGQFANLSIMIKKDLNE